MKRLSKKATFLMISLFIIAVGVAMIFLLLVKQTAAPQVPATPVPSKAKDRDLEARTPLPTSTDVLNIVTKQPIPGGWKVDVNDKLAATVALPPDMIATQAAVSLGGGQMSETTTYIGFDANINNRVCNVSKDNVPLAEANEKIEILNSADDGKITDKPSILWYVILNKDEFAYEGRPAVKYNIYIRPSGTSERRYGVIYKLSSGSNATYEFSCTLTDKVNEQLADAIFRQITVRP